MTSSVIMTVREQAYQGIKNAIIQGEFKSGARLPEIPLAERCGVARTAIREALSQLEQDGLVVRRSGMGAMVVSFNEKEYEELNLVRFTLEALAIEQAILKMRETDEISLRNAVANIEAGGMSRVEFMSYDEKFHASIVEIADMPRLKLILLNQHVIANIIFAANAFFSKRMGTEKERGEFHIAKQRTVHEEHCRIVEAIIRRDGDGAKDILRQHIIE